MKFGKDALLLSAHDARLTTVDTGGSLSDEMQLLIGMEIVGLQKRTLNPVGMAG